MAVIPTRDKTRYLHPVISIQLRRLHILARSVVLDGPAQQSRLVLRPVLLGRVSLLVLQLLQFAEDLGGLSVVHYTVSRWLLRLLVQALVQLLEGLGCRHSFEREALPHKQIFLLRLQHAIRLELASLG